MFETDDGALGGLARDIPDDTDPSEGLTVGQVSARLGVTVRALHHWDDIALARPSLRTLAGYRLYTTNDLERLSRIVVYREIGVGLEDIRTMLDVPNTDPVAALRAQRQQISQRIDRLQQLRAGMDRMIAAHERGVLLTADQQAAIFGPDWNNEWPTQARQRYGNTAEWRQYAERSATRSPEEWQVVADEMHALDRAFGDAMDKGVSPGSSDANRLVDRHRELFSTSYFPLTMQMQVCLGRKYEADASFAAHYDGIHSGLASWLRQSIDARARADGIDPHTATWQ